MVRAPRTSLPYAAPAEGTWAKCSTFLCSSPLLDLNEIVSCSPVNEKILVNCVIDALLSKKLRRKAGRNPRKASL